MGEVYRARDTKVGRDIALEILAAIQDEARSYTGEPCRANWLASGDGKRPGALPR
jgi:hypothetical protein